MRADRHGPSDYCHSLTMPHEPTTPSGTDVKKRHAADKTKRHPGNPYALQVHLSLVHPSGTPNRILMRLLREPDRGSRRTRLDMCNEYRDFAGSGCWVCGADVDL